MFIQLQGISKTYTLEKESIYALKQADLQLEAGDWLTITGPSGSGKTTLLRCLSGIERADSGIVRIGEIDMMTATQGEIRYFRRNNIGYIFQDFQLFDQFDLLTNVMIPLLPYEKKRIVEEKARRLLELVHLSDRIHHKPKFVSGGEKQRTAIARALMNDPQLLLCDEPTGNLDVENRDNIMNILQEIQLQGVTVVLVTHDHELATFGNVLYEMRDGKLLEKRMSKL